MYLACEQHHKRWKSWHMWRIELPDCWISAKRDTCGTPSNYIGGHSFVGIRLTISLQQLMFYVVNWENIAYEQNSDMCIHLFHKYFDPGAFLFYWRHMHILAYNRIQRNAMHCMRCPFTSHGVPSKLWQRFKSDLGSLTLYTVWCTDELNTPLECLLVRLTAVWLIEEVQLLWKYTTAAFKEGADLMKMKQTTLELHGFCFAYRSTKF